MRYRAEIDGLRAVAVLPVIFFHAGFENFSGGYVGVDVFFVISGYLITTIILTEVAEGRFSLWGFYERRARRILPALFLVMMVCTPLAWLWLLPRDMQNYVQSLVAATAFTSNVHFWLESGYFDTSAELKPLLHTWSLAIEEQYYIVFPLLFLITRRLGLIVAAISSAFIVSLGLAHWGSSEHPIATFYLLPTRGWELLLGALVGIYLYRRAVPAPAGISKQLAGVSGLLLILYSVLAFDRQTPFPSLYALVPTAGAALVILCGRSETLTGRLLSNKTLVRIGLISYSMYLWHQPIFAFARYLTYPEPSAATMLGLCILTLPLAYLTWHFVEVPFRDAVRIRRATLFRAAAFLASCHIAFGLFMHTLLATDIPEESQATVKEAKHNHQVMLLGDSHAGHLYAGLTAELGPVIDNQKSDGCIPFYNVDRYDSRFKPGDCVKKMNEALRRFEHSTELKTIVMATMGPVYLDGSPFNNQYPERVKGLGVVLIDDPSITDRWKVFELGMRTTLKHLSSLDGKNVVFVLDVPEIGADMRYCDPAGKELSVLGAQLTVRTKKADGCSVPREDFDLRVARYHALVRRVASEFPTVTLFDPTQLFCDERVCTAIHNGIRLYRDTDHLSRDGSLYLAKALAPVIRSTL